MIEHAISSVHSQSLLRRSGIHNLVIMLDLTPSSAGAKLNRLLFGNTTLNQAIVGHSFPAFLRDSFC